MHRLAFVYQSPGQGDFISSVCTHGVVDCEFSITVTTQSQDSPAWWPGESHGSLALELANPLTAGCLYCQWFLQESPCLSLPFSVSFSSSLFILPLELFPCTSTLPLPLWRLGGRVTNLNVMNGRPSLGFQECPDEQVSWTLNEGSQELNFSTEMCRRAQVSVGVGFGVSPGLHCAGCVV